ncbi:MAG: hypothetical protein IPL49_17870 [Saprospirales bacterium]|nr:hypothetical protein [Saprospirales bacterium]
MSRWSVWLIVVLASLAGWNLRAQELEVQIKVLGFEEGALASQTYKIQQDTMGFVWLATFNGLNRHDGYEFLSFEVPDSISGQA